jgi:hypothetical protein
MKFGKKNHGISLPSECREKSGGAAIIIRTARIGTEIEERTNECQDAKIRGSTNQRRPVLQNRVSGSSSQTKTMLVNEMCT